MEKGRNGYVRAQDIVDCVAMPQVQNKLANESGRQVKISLCTAQRWMHRMEWRYGRKRNGMYIDGHERPDVVEYRNKFVKQWQEYEKRMETYNNDGDLDKTPVGFPVPGGWFQIILITHDESTFYANDQ